MRSTPARVGVAIVLAGLVAVAAGCGGGSKNSTPGPTHPTTATIKSVSVPAGRGPASSFSSAKNCQDLAGLAAKVASAVTTSSSSNPASVLQTESNELHALAQSAPSEIRGDFQTFSTAFSSLINAVQKSGYTFGTKTPPTAAQIAAFSTAARQLDTLRLKQARQHLSAWAKTNCKGVHVGG